MRISTLAFVILLPATAFSAYAQQASPQAVQDEADKGVKTRNSGASGVVGDQKPGSADMPGQMGGATPSAAQSNAQNSGTGVSGAPGNKNGPPANAATTGAAPNAVQQQDSSGVKGLPGNKSGPPAKR
jgi:hypothetical protein